MKLFQVPAGKKVRITSKTVKWKTSDTVEKVLAENVTWTGITTDKYYNYAGSNRRLITNPNINFWKNYGVWQSDCDCEII